MSRSTQRSSSSAASGDCEPAVVLVVDDEATICWGFQRLLQEDGLEVLTASSAEEGLALAADRKPNLVLLDVRLPHEDGISALPKFISVTDGAPVVVMTAFGDLETAVAAVQRGASDYLTKPFRLEDARRVCRVVLRSYQSRVRAQTPRIQDNWDAQRIVGQSPAIQNAYKQIALVASSDLSVLITGETGTGKELVAAAIHRHSARSQRPYYPVSPVAMNPDLIESELFGHVRGAFTGATQDRAGLFEQAAGGTILLAEIGELPMNMQVKLLRVLEQREYCRVGEVTARKCDVRILAATNADLHDAVRQGTFREDLFYRLNGLHIHLPPLRQRTEDIGPLCHHFLARLSARQPAELIDDEVLAQLKARPWHGNVRELRNAVEHAAIVSRGRMLAVEDFPSAQPCRNQQHVSTASTLAKAVSDWLDQQLHSAAAHRLAAAQNRGVTSKMGLHAELLAVVKPTHLQLMLQQATGNGALAAELLCSDRVTQPALTTLHVSECPP